MHRLLPRGLSRPRIERALSKARGELRVSHRIETLSRLFLGHSYKPNPLIGSGDSTEVFSTSLSGFDCVTYIETMVALARASNVEDFIEELRQIRYERGSIRWEERNHYMTLWIHRNIQKGIVSPVSAPAVPTISRERILDVVPGLAARRLRVKCLPKAAVAKLEPYLRSGDLIFFVSARKNLDVFHAGIIVRDGESVLLRHASRSQGLVVEQTLMEFLRANRTPGVLVVRPQERRPRVQQPG
jgi:Protein of unknown function (DUF1460)